MHILSSRVELQKFNSRQMIEMDKYKWIESEKAGHDLGSAAYLEWISKYAKSFRDTYVNQECN